MAGRRAPKGASHAPWGHACRRRRNARKTPPVPTSTRSGMTGLRPSMRLRRACRCPQRMQGQAPFHFKARQSPPASVAAGVQCHEAHAFQCHARGRNPRRHRRWTEAHRHRHRDRGPRSPQVQHLQGRRDPHRAQPRSLLRQLRRRAPRLPSLQGNLPRLLQGRRRRPFGLHPRSHHGRSGTDRSGRKGRARQQGRRPHDLHQPCRPLSRPHAEQSARWRRLPPH